MHAENVSIHRFQTKAEQDVTDQDQHAHALKNTHLMDFNALNALQDNLPLIKTLYVLLLQLALMDNNTLVI